MSDHTCHLLEQSEPCPGCLIARTYMRDECDVLAKVIEANNQTISDEIVHAAKLMIQGWTKEQQQELYQWLHDVLNCRIYENK